MHYFRMNGAPIPQKRCMAAGGVVHLPGTLALTRRNDGSHTPDTRLRKGGIFTITLGGCSAIWASSRPLRTRIVFRGITKPQILVGSNHCRPESAVATAPQRCISHYLFLSLSTWRGAVHDRGVAAVFHMGWKIGDCPVDISLIARSK